MIPRTQFAAMAVTLCAVWLIGSRDVTGQWLMLAAQGLWLAVAFVSELHGLAVQSVILAGMTIRAIVEWSS